MRSLVLAALLAGSLVACSAEASPREQLRDAAEGTFSGSFAYTFRVAADREALASLGPEGARAGSFLKTFHVAGRHTDEAFELTMSLLGFDVLQLRSLRGDVLYLRVGLQDLARLAGAETASRVVPLLQARRVGGDVIAAVQAAFRGEWLRVEGEIDPQELGAALGEPTSGGTPAEKAKRLRAALGGDVVGFIERYVGVEEVTERGRAKDFDVSFRLRDVVRAVAAADPTKQMEDLEAALEMLPAQVPGAVTVDDGEVRRIAVHLAEAIRAAGGEVAGSLDLRLDLSQHGQVKAVEAPRSAVPISGDELVEALGAIGPLMSEAGDAPSGVSPNPR